MSNSIIQFVKSDKTVYDKECTQQSNIPSQQKRKQAKTLVIL